MFNKRFNGWEESYQVMQSPPQHLRAQKPGFCPPRALNDTYMTIGGALNCLNPLLAKAWCRKGPQRCFGGTKKGMGSEETAVRATSPWSINHATVGPAPGPSLLFFPSFSQAASPQTSMPKLSLVICYLGPTACNKPPPFVPFDPPFSDSWL